LALGKMPTASSWFISGSKSMVTRYLPSEA
jgi:hypothetical protein